MEKETQIKDTTAFLMIFTALCFDGIQAAIGWIPIAGNILADLMSIFIFLTFFLWFYMEGIKMITPKRLTSMIGGGLIEMVPYLNLLPAWTMVVVYLIGTTKIKEMAKKHPTLAKGALLAGGAIKNLNNGRIPNTPIVDRKNNESVDVSRGAQEARNLEKARQKNSEIIDVSPGAQERKNLENSLKNSPENKNKIKSMEINDELLELNNKPNLDQIDKERLQRAHKIMTSGHIEDKEKKRPGFTTSLGKS